MDAPLSRELVPPFVHKRSKDALGSFVALGRIVGPVIALAPRGRVGVGEGSLLLDPQVLECPRKVVLQVLKTDHKIEGVSGQADHVGVGVRVEPHKVGLKVGIVVLDKAKPGDISEPLVFDNGVYLLMKEEFLPQE